MVNSSGKVLITEDEIKQEIFKLAQKITEDYKNKNLTIIGVLNGGLVFLSDLIRQISFPVKIDTIKAKSYVGDSTSPKADIDIVNNINIDVVNEHVLILDDILDTGKTLSNIIRMIKAYNPLSLKVCVFLNKVTKRGIEVKPDYCCFEIEDRFVVGYGLDFDNKYRNLPYVAVLEDAI